MKNNGKFENIILLTTIDSSIKHIIKIQLHCQLEVKDHSAGSLLCSIDLNFKTSAGIVFKAIFSVYLSQWFTFYMLVSNLRKWILLIFVPVTTNVFDW